MHDRGVKARQATSSERLAIGRLKLHAVAGRAAVVVACQRALLIATDIASDAIGVLLLVTFLRSVIAQLAPSAALVVVSAVVVVKKLGAHGDVLEKVERRDVARHLARVRVHVARALAVDA